MNSLPSSIHDAVTGHLVLPPRPPITAPWPSHISPLIRHALAKRGVNELWTHQTQAIEELSKNNHVVLATGTGSGKSLAAWIPALNDILSYSISQSLKRHRSKPTALYLSPTKALAADQLANLSQLANEIDPHIVVATADGDSDTPTRHFAREHADIILSNPDFLHFSLLSKHEKWARLWRGLRYLIVDEFHHYRGNFGAHVSLIVRRALRIAAHYGAFPRVIFLSATSAHPRQDAQRFLGSAFGPVSAITHDGSPISSREIYTVSPSDSAAQTAALLTAELVLEGKQLLTFVRSRQGVERVAELAQNFLLQLNPGISQSIAAYRGGYLPEERRDLEARLSNGSLRALVTTSALELGIDIAGLDAVITTGWPGTHASFHQQMGRAGRAGCSGTGIFIARDNPLDQYIVNHPQILSQPPKESSTFDPTNPAIMPAHLCAAAHELPLTQNDMPIFSLPSTGLLDQMVANDLLRTRPTGWFWNTATRIEPHTLLDLRGENTTIAIVNSVDGTVLGTVDSARADTTVFPGAIYLHQGRTFEILQCQADVALAQPALDADIRTFARTNNSVDIISTTYAIELPDGQWSYGTVNVRSQVIGYDVRRASDGIFLGTVPLQMPEREFITSGTWISIAEHKTRQQHIDTADLPGALHGGEHTMIAMLPLLATCDRWDIGGLSTPLHPDTQQPTIIIHDAISGGSGAALRGYHAGRMWLEATHETLTTCPCESGCPSCVQSPKCGNNNQPLSKGGALDLMSVLLEQIDAAS
ncbi:DEAD/DEAH box helicase [Arcanobacterium pinnipediorum]|uniref:DEAD/DEAH box helicase n=1 Tax=Arcanobacterium pinnipediorum TaxID=1503041 RepID=A0ABY5AGI8_9ACTO|nr:DEAD/DEAH box helicase [Arcanobacterium pinnipediorum]USR79309.1 DEAD/DEAH box helicase [Arcanobacterium pinnipediorum]